MKPKGINNFDSTNEIYERFETVTNHIRFENCEYKYQNILFEGEVKKHIYRCDEEQHNLVISMMGDVVVNVVGVYSIGEVAI